MAFTASENKLDGTKTTRPSLSIVIPTDGRAALVSNMLASIQEARKCTATEVEVIVVDSSPEKAALSIQLACEQYRAVYLRGSVSVRHKRNMGVSAALAAYVLFLDSDCQVDSQLLNEHIRTWETSDPKMAGVTGLTKFVGNANFFWKIMEHTPFLDAFRFAERFPCVQWAITNNLSVKKDMFLKIGGFDENLPYRLGWDDIDLGLRLTQAGYCIRSLPSALVYHEKETWNGLGSQISRLWRWGQLRFWILRKHPSLKRYDPIKPSTAFLLAIFLLIAASIIQHKLAILVLLLFWLPLSTLAIAVVRILFRKMPATEIFFEWGAECLLVIHDLATLFESLRQFSLLWISHRLIFHDSQFENEFQTDLERFWGLAVTFLLLGFAALFLAIGK